MRSFGWTYDELQATPEDVVSDAIAYLSAQATEGPRHGPG